MFNEEQVDEEDSEADEEPYVNPFGNANSKEIIKTIDMYEPLPTEPNKILNHNHEIIKLDNEILKKVDERQSLSSKRDSLLNEFKNKTKSTKLISSVIVKRNSKLIPITGNNYS